MCNSSETIRLEDLEGQVIEHLNMMSKKIRKEEDFDDYRFVLLRIFSICSGAGITVLLSKGSIRIGQTITATNGEYEGSVKISKGDNGEEIFCRIKVVHKKGDTKKVLLCICSLFPLNKHGYVKKIGKIYSQLAGRVSAFRPEDKLLTVQI